jgi:hypothetical protein
MAVSKNTLQMAEAKHKQNPGLKEGSERAKRSPASTGSGAISTLCGLGKREDPVYTVCFLSVHAYDKI